MKTIILFLIIALVFPLSVNAGYYWTECVREGAIRENPDTNLCEYFEASTSQPTPAPSSGGGGSNTGGINPNLCEYPQYYQDCDVTELQKQYISLLKQLIELLQLKIALL